MIDDDLVIAQAEGTPQQADVTVEQVKPKPTRTRRPATARTRKKSLEQPSEADSSGVAVSDQNAEIVAEATVPEEKPAPKKRPSRAKEPKEPAESKEPKAKKPRKKQRTSPDGEGAVPVSDAVAPTEPVAVSDAANGSNVIEENRPAELPQAEDQDEAAPAKRKGRSSRRSKKVDQGDLSVEELKELATKRRRGRPSPQKEEARQQILTALADPSPESLEVARKAAEVLGSAVPPKDEDIQTVIAPESAGESARVVEEQVVAASPTEGSAEASSTETTSPEANSSETNSSPDQKEGYGPRRRHHDRRAEGKQPQGDSKEQQREPQDRKSRDRKGGQERQKFNKNDRRDRNGRKDRDYPVSPSMSLQDLLELSEEELVAKANELEVETDGVEFSALAELVYSALFKHEGFFEFSGILETSNEGGFVRMKGYLASPSDLSVAPMLIRTQGLRRGDVVAGVAKSPRGGEKRSVVCRIDSINGRTPEELRSRPRFGDLTPVFPCEELKMEHGKESILGRVVDLVAPIGKGQRGLIVSPPKAGKTTVLKKIAESISANNPEVHLICLLVDERPEEVTDMRRSIRGEVVASTFDMPCENHIAVSELVIERAKRLVEQGEDVVILLDSITRLARAYNLAQPASGRILSGGVDSTALYPPKRFLGAARNIEDGGSLTILASALVDTGSKMDEVIFEEFKGTGNMELKLDRELAERRIFPAVDPVASGTRKEELLLDPSFAPLVWGLRRILANMNNNERAMSMLIKALKATNDNEEFLVRTAKKAQGQEFAGEL